MLVNAFKRRLRSVFKLHEGGLPILGCLSSNFRVATPQEWGGRAGGGGGRGPTRLVVQWGVYIGLIWSTLEIPSGWNKKNLLVIILMEISYNDNNNNNLFETFIEPLQVPVCLPASSHQPVGRYEYTRQQAGGGGGSHRLAAWPARGPGELRWDWVSFLLGFRPG